MFDVVVDRNMAWGSVHPPVATERVSVRSFAHDYY